MPDIAIVILNWNTKKQLETFLPSIIQYSQEEKVEVIVADNGSNDGSPEFLRENYPNLRTILFDQNYGFTGGYNKALAQIEAKYYVILNSDIEVTENWLKPLKKCMEDDPSVAACMPKIKAYHKKDHFEYAGAAGGFIDRYGYPFCRGRILDTTEKDKGQYNHQTEIFWATGACMFVRADLFHRLGGFDDDFFAHMEEIDLCWRLKNSGYTIQYVPKSVIYHVGGGTLPNENPFKLYLNYRNNLFLLYKNLPRKKLYSVLLTRICMDWLSGLMYLLQGKSRNFSALLRSHRHFFGRLKSQRKKRKFNSPPERDFPGQVFPGSIVFQYFLRRRRRFSQLKHIW
jgi:hypothetical protein